MNQMLRWWTFALIYYVHIVQDCRVLLLGGVLVLAFSTLLTILVVEFLDYLVYVNAPHIMLLI